MVQNNMDENDENKEGEAQTCRKSDRKYKIKRKKIFEPRTKSGKIDKRFKKRVKQTCKDCGAQFVDNEERYIEHLGNSLCPNYRLTKDEEGKDLWVCRIKDNRGKSCNKSYNSRNSMKGHLLRIHNKGMLKSTGTNDEKQAEGEKGGNSQQPETEESDELPESEDTEMEEINDHEVCVNYRLTKDRKGKDLWICKVKDDQGKSCNKRYNNRNSMKGHLLRTHNKGMLKKTDKNIKKQTESKNSPTMPSIFPNDYLEVQIGDQPIQDNDYDTPCENVAKDPLMVKMEESHELVESEDMEMHEIKEEVIEIKQEALEIKQEANDFNHDPLFLK
eukprot:TRINITY_DN9348_c0_g2_i21.p1 TRINITY_DN9348_c0_g2~~TRINITY_DN9348_c0_g2_i21.p1  ORF type:complete len:331 (+),score=55.54 TRINITY_DN9348_c0_g2_i21:112-1104(+)